MSDEPWSLDRRRQEAAQLFGPRVGRMSDAEYLEFEKRAVAHFNAGFTQEQFATAALFDAVTGERLDDDILPAPTALGRALNKQRKESR